MTDSYDKSLMHYGVLGMKWGKRKDKRSGTKVSTRSGEQISIHEKKNGRFIAKNSKNKKVGTFYLDNKSYGVKKVTNKQPNRDLHIDWMSTRKKYEGKGYAQAMMDFIEKYAKNKNYSSISSEPVSPKTLHILEKYGHKRIGEFEDESWGIVPVMKKNIKR